MIADNIARVFVIQQPRARTGGWTPDLSSADKFGRIEYIFNGDDRPYVTPAAALEKLRERLADFNPESDYLLWAHFGDPAGMWLALMYLSGVLGFGKLRFLYWTKERQPGGERFPEKGYYFPITLDIN